MYKQYHITPRTRTHSSETQRNYPACSVYIYFLMGSAYGYVFRQLFFETFCLSSFPEYYNFTLSKVRTKCLYLFVLFLSESINVFEPMLTFLRKCYAFYTRNLNSLPLTIGDLTQRYIQLYRMYHHLLSQPMRYISLTILFVGGWHRSFSVHLLFTTLIA